MKKNKENIVFSTISALDNCIDFNNTQDIIEFCEANDINLVLITEDEYNMSKKEEYHPITSPFEIFVTLNKKGQHFSVSV